MKNGFRFSRHYDGHTVKVRAHEDSDLDQIAEALESFLKGCGYVFGELVIETDDEDVAD